MPVFVGRTKESHEKPVRIADLQAEMDISKEER
jgi:hypothetical protein